MSSHAFVCLPSRGAAPYVARLGPSDTMRTASAGPLSGAGRGFMGTSVRLPRATALPANTRTERRDVLLVQCKKKSTKSGGKVPKRKVGSSSGVAAKSTAVREPSLLDDLEAALPSTDPADLEIIRHLETKRTLVLDISHKPIDVVGWQRAVCMDIFDKADVLEYYEDTEVKAPSDTFAVPAVVRVRFYVQGGTGGQVSVSRRNIMIRDSFTCQYCGSKRDQTIDHVLPMSKGGQWTWDNLVTACSGCNSKKGNKLLNQCGMKLRCGMPKPPNFASIAYSLVYAHNNLRNNPPSEWEHYLPKPKAGEEANPYRKRDSLPGY